MTRFVLCLAAGIAATVLASAVHAADLIVDEPAPAVGIVSASGNWNGVYVGAFAGYGWGTLTDEFGYFIGGVGAEHSSSGWQLGATVGADFTLAETIVAGIAADIAWANIGGEDAGGLEFNTDWAGSVRGRIGFDGGAFLPYVTAGLAFAAVTVTDTVSSNEDTMTHVGWTAGAGIEFAVADNVSLDLQYRYSDYGTQSYDLLLPGDFSLTSHAVTAGVNFRF